MKKSIVTLTTALSLTSSLVTPAFSGVEEAFSNHNSVKAGLYLRIPFSGGLKPTKKNDISYGFKMGVGREFATNSFMDPAKKFSADMINLRFSSQGFDNFSFAGQPLINDRGVWLSADGENGGISSGEWAWIAIGGAALIVGGIVLLKGKSCPPGGTLFEGECVIIDPEPQPNP